ncbi:MAG: hypothetical protein A2268_01790 [Candidatus Raymondbacteria bacterium RifOxyA12_full_50_37]|uniref:Uncharacterized protein n=1 Tax=Candidatus Raymondbacteria bacterium RIFOXYD12_FULL_49_13 TaxID=1817890 RepID=A0A1F7FIH6_UNCRA|nr:MAG: hypothetical protein A2268_01790 [Candidatus Raymondbacteria bacterium RifOxyA12_full_50_37]OGJ90805.1 MAG: hypothetical protein A2248_02295 [Candidatus Raymondbacteria bacterium RIFOXYA2_FULL_49_16]OGJ97372.1 MAG: hypothetical protein A2453_03575 [Candidatus Raymondbacteria bacterium RIFOXYC2_FULL_50_21]OGJ98715.1 MAG: hypothetical protein A2350_09775 [Candidatus Raymondbacteria bacterium RifOxyB12_full_50_8]OGK06477.1 MAG: hypothetical protein A2487_21380 [Candidatus Raymondbacteria b
MMKLIGMIAIAAALSSGSITQQTYLTDGKGHLADRTRGQLINLTWNEKKMENGLKMFYGKAEWTAEAGAEGQNAEVPVAVYWLKKETQSLVPPGHV